MICSGRLSQVISSSATSKALSFALWKALLGSSSYGQKVQMSSRRSLLSMRFIPQMRAIKWTVKSFWSRSFIDPRIRAPLSGHHLKKIRWSHFSLRTIIEVSVTSTFGSFRFHTQTLCRTDLRKIWRLRLPWFRSFSTRATTRRIKRTPAKGQTKNASVATSTWIWRRAMRRLHIEVSSMKVSLATLIACCRRFSHLGPSAARSSDCSASMATMWCVVFSASSTTCRWEERARGVTSSSGHLATAMHSSSSSKMRVSFSSIW